MEKTIKPTITLTECLNRFWAENARQSFTRAEILLYLYLNQNADSFDAICRSTAELAAALHLCAGTILRARKSLKERGVITLTKSGSKTTYRLLPYSTPNRVENGGGEPSLTQRGPSPTGCGHTALSFDHPQRGVIPAERSNPRLLEYSTNRILDRSDKSDLSDISYSPRPTNNKQRTTLKKPHLHNVPKSSWPLHRKIFKKIHRRPER